MCVHEADVVSWVYTSIGDLIVCQINHVQQRADVTFHIKCPIECIVNQ